MSSWKRKNGAHMATKGKIQVRVKMVEGGFELKMRDASGAWREIKKNGRLWPTAEQAKSRAEIELG